MTSLVLGALLLLTSSQSVNFFSLKQDVEIGSASEKEAKQQVMITLTVQTMNVVHSGYHRISL